MYTPLQNCFRKDLIITSTTNQETLAKCYSVKDPKSGEIFEFGAEEYFLCQSMNGTSTPSEIIADFKRNFDLSLTEEDFNDFSRQIVEYGLLESLSSTVSVPSSFYLERTQASPFLPTATNKTQLSKVTQEKTKNNYKKQKSEKKKGPVYLWFLSNPSPKFTALASLFKPLRLFFKVLIWGLIPGLPLGFYTLFDNQSDLWHDIHFLDHPLPYLTTYVFNITVASLTAKLAQGIIFAHYGGKVKKFGLVLAAGFFPRFYLDRGGMWQLKRNQQLWAFSAPLVSRLVLFVLGLLIWYWNRGTATDLRTLALLLAHASLVDFLLDGCPLWPVDGYVFMLSYFRLPANFLERVSLVWEMVLSRRPVPSSLSSREKLGLQLFGLAALLFWLSMVVLLAYHMANGLITTFPELFGSATSAIIICLVFAAALRQPVGFFRKTFGKKRTSQASVTTETSVLDRELVTRHKKPKTWRKKWTRLLILICVCIILLLPYPYSPGGQIQLLPPTQQAIQAQVEGQIIKVLFPGGDGQWIKAGTLVAQMEAIDIENDVLTQQEQIKNQEAIVEKQQSILNKLLATPRKEDIEVARQQVEVAKKDVEVARQQVEVAKQEVQVARKKLDTVISQAEFSSREASRFEELYNGGVVSRQTFEDKKKQAETDRLDVDENRQNVAAKQQQVESSQNALLTKQQTVAQKQAYLEQVLSGPYPDEIQAARKEVEAARAVLKRQQQQLKYDQEQLRRTQLVMPIDGRLTTPYLNQKVGSYLKKGGTFAVAEDDRNIRAEVRVTEYNVGEFNLGAPVKVKLWAYPNRPFIGKVFSIEPAAFDQNASSNVTSAPTSNSTNRIVRVIVDIPNREKLLKTSMTGYAKIKGSTKPVIVAFTRPIVRFVQIEIWSWFP